MSGQELQIVNCVLTKLLSNYVHNIASCYISGCHSQQIMLDETGLGLGLAKKAV